MGIEREAERDETPHGGEPFGCLHVMGIGGVAFDEMGVNIHRGGRAERAEFGGLGREGRGKKGGDQQTDDAMRELRQNKGDEDVVAVVCLGMVTRGARRHGMTTRIASSAAM